MEMKRYINSKELDYHLFSAEVTNYKITSLRKYQLMRIIIALVIGFLTLISNALILGGITFSILIVDMINREKAIFNYKRTLKGQIELIETNINLLIPDNLLFEGNTIKARLNILKNN